METWIDFRNDSDGSFSHTTISITTNTECAFPFKCLFIFHTLTHGGAAPPCFYSPPSSIERRRFSIRRWQRIISRSNKIKKQKQKQIDVEHMKIGRRFCQRANYAYLGIWIQYYGLLSKFKITHILRFNYPT